MSQPGPANLYFGFTQGKLVEEAEPDAIIPYREVSASPNEKQDGALGLFRQCFKKDVNSDSVAMTGKSW